MSTSEISVGTKVEFDLFNSSGVKIGSTYTGEFSEIVSDRNVIIFLNEQLPVQLSFLENIQITAFYEHKLLGLQSFKGIISHKEKVKSGIKFYIKIDEFQTIQKREYFRPACFLKTEYRLANKTDNNTGNSMNDIPYKSTQTKNISATGVCIFTDTTDAIMIHDLIDVIVWLNDTLSINIQCKVVRVMEFQIEKTEKQEIGMLIERINEDDRENLTKFLTKNAMVRSLYWGETP